RHIPSKELERSDDTALEDDNSDEGERVRIIIGSFKLSDIFDLSKTFSPHNLAENYEGVLRHFSDLRRKNFSSPLSYEERAVSMDDDEYYGVVKMYGEVIAKYDGQATDDEVEYNYPNLIRGVRRFVQELEGQEIDR